MGKKEIYLNIHGKKGNISTHTWKRGNISTHTWKRGNISTHTWKKGFSQYKHQTVQPYL